MHSPVFDLYAARCLVKLGRWLDASSRLQVVANDELPESAPLPWHQARSSAASELAALREDIPKVELHLLSRFEPYPTVTLDNGVLEFFQGKASVLLDPGPHEILVERGHTRLESRLIDLRPAREPLVISLGPYVNPLELDVPVNAIVPPKTQGATAASPEPMAQPSSATRRGAYMALGLGLLGVGIGAIAGAVAWHERNQLYNQCGGWVCQEDFSRRTERGRAFGNVSTAAFLSAAAGFATAGILFYYTPTQMPRRGGVELGLTGRF
jgi:hypothetical protein